MRHPLRILQDLSTPLAIPLEEKLETAILSRPARKQLRQRLLEEQKSCSYCGVPLPNRHGVSLDHMIPTARGGINAAGNLVLCCVTCNQNKGSLTVDEFLRLLITTACKFRQRLQRARRQPATA